MSHPIVQRELVAMLRSRWAATMQISMAVLFAVLVALRWPTDSRVDLAGEQSRAVFALFGYGVLATLLLLTPIFPATTIVRERVQGTLALLFNTPLSSWSIYFGKLFGVLGLTLILLSMSLPAAAACYAMGGSRYRAICC